MLKAKKTGRVTIPTDLDVVPQTLDIMKLWGSDAIRDCDGTDFPAELQNQDAKIYSTYYTTRKDNAWAKANPDEVQQSRMASAPQRFMISRVSGTTSKSVGIVTRPLFIFSFILINSLQK